MSLSRRRLLGILSGAALGSAVGPISSKAFANQSQEPKKLIAEMPPLKPPFRLPVSWYQNTTKRLQARLKENNLDGILLNDQQNIIYVSGLFHTKTERPFWLFVPAVGEPVFFHPGLDRDLVESWWVKEHEWYFDYPHHGEFNKIVYQAGSKTDLIEWALKSLSRRGFGTSTIGVDWELTQDGLSRMNKALPEAKFKVAGSIPLKMRQIKTSEEIELTQKAIDLHDHMLEYAHTYILEHGTHATDYDVRSETERYATHLLMKWLKVDGRPHTGVGISLGLGCRTGVATAYPHPNQFFYLRIQKGDAIQIASVIRIGGYGGEGYRALQTEPMNDLQKKMWEVHTEQTLLQSDLCKAGARCNEIAEKVLAVARNAGLEKYIYHRPAHGEGMEGHQPPYLSLGDETVLEEGMMFSNEPGLYNPERGYGYNHSNNILVGKEKGIRMNKTPLTKEWCWLKIS